MGYMFRNLYFLSISFLLNCFKIISEEKIDFNDFIKKESINDKYDESKIDRDKFVKIEIVFSYSRNDFFYFYLPKQKYNWNSFLENCKEFAENPQYSPSYEYIKTNHIFKNRVFKYDLYDVKPLENKVKNVKNYLENKLKDHKLEGDFYIDDDYSFGFQNGCYYLCIFRDCKLRSIYNEKYEKIRYNIKLCSYNDIMTKINDCFADKVLGIYSDKKCTKEIKNEGGNLTKVNDDFIYLKFKDDCYEVLYYDYDLDLDDDDKGKDHYVFYTESSYDIRKNEQTSIYDFFRDLCKNEIRYNNFRYNFQILGGYSYSGLDDFDKYSSVLKKVIIIDNNGNKNEINTIEDFKKTIMNKDYKYEFILYKNNNITEYEFLTEKGEETIFEKKVYDYRNSVPKYLKDIWKDEIDVYGCGMLPLKVQYFDYMIKNNIILKIIKVDNGKEIELPIKNLDYPLLSGNYKVICYNKFGKKEQEKRDEYTKKLDEDRKKLDEDTKKLVEEHKELDKILEDREKSCCNRMC